MFIVNYTIFVAHFIFFSIKQVQKRKIYKKNFMNIFVLKNQRIKISKIKFIDFMRTHSSPQ